jgi:ABC-type lipoprotein export system ATPase subunit
MVLQEASKPEEGGTCSDIYIAIMGVTGCGKSTFISMCTSEAGEFGHQRASSANNHPADDQSRNPSERKV